MKKIKFLLISFMISFWSFNLNAADWTMASGYPKSNFHTQNIMKFIDEVKANTSVNINLNPNDSHLPFKLTSFNVCFTENSF